MVRPLRTLATKPRILNQAASFNNRSAIQRFDGINKMAEPWDHLRKDDELWFEDGDAIVHLYAPTTSRRGPSLKVPFKIIQQTKSQYLLRECLQSSPVSSEDDNSDSGYSGSAAGSHLECAELYIPAPACATRQESHLYHLGTRNYFAYLFDQPLVGETLGLALVELWNRIHLWQPSDIAESDFRVYCKEQGYMSYVENPEYAIATLYFAEQTRNKDMWSEAFVHCVGMHDRLEWHEDFDRLSDESKDLLAQASADMKSHIARVTKSLGTFLEEDLGPENLGLSKPLRDHLDRFRSTLHCFYVHEINGYFPPDETDPWGKKLWRGMYGDFQSLYVYLADTKSSGDHASNLGAQGGICVAQNLRAFDGRHDFAPLPYSLPLLPETKARVEQRSPVSRRSLGSLRMSRSGTMGPHRPTPGQALADATNRGDADVTRNRLVQEYMRFESLKMEEKTTIIEARKVRWLLVYSALQLLISITKAPAEVRDTTGPSYPLCVRNTACPTWEDEKLTLHTQETQDEPAAQHATAVEEAVRKSLEEDRISIHPDCEASCAADYFSMNSFSRTDSGTSLSSMATPPVRTNSTLSRTASIRSSVSTLHRSMVGSLARRNSQRRGSFITPSVKSPTVGTFCETLHELQGSEVEESSPVDSMMDFDAKLASAKPELVSSVSTAVTDGDVPVLEMHQLSMDDTAQPVRRLRHTSGRHKRRKSTNTESIACGHSASELDLPQRLASDLGGFEFDFDMPVATAEQITPSSAEYHAISSRPGIGRAHSSPLAEKSRVMSTSSLASMASNSSSIYPETSLQADEIEEEEVRGRRRRKGLDRLRDFAYLA